MSEYEAYPEYRDSGVEWIPEYPSEWQLAKVKYCARLNPTKNEVRKKPLDLEVSFLPMEAISEDGVIDASTSRLLGDVIDGYTYVGEGDVCIAKITPCFENGKGAVATGLMNKVAFATTEVIPVRPSNSTNADYLYYLLSSAPFRLVAEGAMYGAGGQKRVADTFVANYDFACPPTELQEQIANFLDHETAKIDTLIEKQQQLIKLLKEKRQAVISHAVTKGLNPDAPMKDSGVEWLGEVPAGWDVCRLKHAVRQIVDGAHFTPTYVDSGVPFLRVTDIQSDEIDKSNIKYIPEQEHLALIERCKPEKGDLLLSKNGTIGIPKVVSWDWSFSIFVSLCLIKFGAKISVRYAYYFFMTHQIEKQIFGLIKQSTVINLHLDKIENFWISLPPISDQLLIVENLERQLPRIDLNVENAQKMVDLLKERRTALLSAAVTGKIDVRNWQAPESTLTPSMDA